MIFKSRHIRYIQSCLYPVWEVRIYFFLCFLFFGQKLLFGQEAVDPEPETAEQEQGHNTEIPDKEYTLAADTAKVVFYIRSIDFNISGRSRPFALIYHGEFKAGEQLEGEAELEKYIKDKTQLLRNQRVLETVEIDYTLGEAEAEGLVPVDLLVKVVDTWNIIALPYPKYDSNTGIELIIKARDYNFLGTMSPLRIDLGYEHKNGEIQKESSKDVFKFEIDSDIPFQLFGYKWNLDFDHIFSYTLRDEDSIFYYKNITGFSVEFPYRRTTLTLGLEESSIFSEENPTQYKQKYGDYADFYMSSKLYASWKIPLGFEVYDFGELKYTPNVSGKINYRPGKDLEFWRKGPTLTFGHSLGFGRIDWLGNYRNGLETSISNSNTYDFYNTRWDISYDISLVSHRAFSNFFGISSKVQFRHWFFGNPDSYAETGGALRGIADKSLVAKDNNFMLSLNVDFPVRVLRFLPSEWLHTRKLRFFDFDLHISPFIDIALFWGLNEVKWEGGAIKNLTDPPSLDVPVAIGLEFIIFPAFMRSLYLRASFGRNLFAPSKVYGDEIFIGIGHHY